jgi:hypothetical protein
VFDTIIKFFYGLETEKRLPVGQTTLLHVQDRQLVWKGVSMLDQNPVRRNVAEQAMARYGLLIRDSITSFSPGAD